MNILLVSLDNSEKARIGGKHIHQELLKIGWERAGHSVDTVYPKGKTLWIRKAFRRLLRILKICDPFKNFYASVNDNRKQIEKGIADALRKKNYQFISVQDVLAAVTVKSAFQKVDKKIPVIMTLHGYFSRESVNYGNFSSDEQQRIMDFGMGLEKEASEFVDGIITVDTRIKQYVLTHFRYQKPIQMICNAIDDTRFFPVDSKTQLDLRKKINLVNDRKILLVARRLVKKNGVLYAVEAIKILKDSGFLLEMPLKLLIVGRGPEQKSIQTFIQNNGLSNWVEMVGIVPHRLIDSYYKSADIILMPSTLSDDIEEATSLSMLEGLACGKPVIASAIGGLKEVICDRVNGLLVEDKNPAAIADSIAKVLRDESFRTRIEKNAYLYAKNNCGYFEHSLKFLDFFEEISRKKGSNLRH